MHRSALILGTLAGQVDAIDLLHGQGWTVYACGHREDGPGVTAADGFFLVDIVDSDAVAELAQRLGVDLVYSVGSDIAMPTVAEVSARLSLPGFHDVAITRTLHRKDRLRAFLSDAGLSPVAHRVVRGVADLHDFHHYPAIVKPSDSQGQRGITVVASADEARAALPDALAVSRSRTAVIEEWLDGPEVSVHVVVVEGQVRFFLPSDRHVWDGPLVGIPAAHTLPAHALDASGRAAVRDLVERFVSALGVRTGPLYFQLKITGRNVPRIIEVAPRFDGCHLWRLIAVHTGFDLMDACFRLLMGEGWTDPEPWEDQPAHTLVFHLVPPGEPVRHAQHPLTASNVCFEEWQVAEGDLPRDTNGHICRAGYAIVEDR